MSIMLFFSTYFTNMAKEQIWDDDDSDASAEQSAHKDKKGRRGGFSFNLDQQIKPHNRTLVLGRTEREGKPTREIVRWQRFPTEEGDALMQDNIKMPGVAFKPELALYPTNGRDIRRWETHPSKEGDALLLEPAAKLKGTRFAYTEEDNAAIVFYMVARQTWEKASHHGKKGPEFVTLLDHWWLSDERYSAYSFINMILMLAYCFLFLACSFHPPPPPHTYHTVICSCC